MSQRRRFVMGDPQAPFAKVMAVLERHHALGPDGQLAPDVELISIGDHFDYDINDPQTAGREGLRVLRWLAGHDPDQVHLLLGNHDAARVMELGTVTDERFAAAQRLARSIAETKYKVSQDAADQRERDEFLPQFPEIATFGLASRDYASFSSEQRRLVVELLLAGRFHLALSGQLFDGRTVLLSHAGVTQRELDLLGLPDDRSPQRIAAALNRWLHTAVDSCRTDWQDAPRDAAIKPLPLAPLHVPGHSGEEGGGLLYHRPVCPDRRGADLTWELASAHPRRFDPRTLPPGLIQVVGHTGHRKCIAELGDDWPTPAARAHPVGGIRTLRVQDGHIVYDLGVLPSTDSAAALILIDGEMRHASDVALLPLAAIH